MAATILLFPAAKVVESGKERIRSRRERLGLAAPRAEDLTMDHADNVVPSDPPYCAPSDDCA